MPCPSKKPKQKGFTLLELLLVISIIIIISVIGLVMYMNVQKNARNAKRITDLKAVALALEQYYHDPVNNSQYPNPGGSWRGECDHPWGTPNLDPEDVIPGLVPKYLQKFPADPMMDKDDSHSCYMYRSNGNNYALLDHDIREFGNSWDDYSSYQSFIDPSRDGGPLGEFSLDGTGCSLNGTNPWSWKISSPGGRCF